MSAVFAYYVLLIFYRPTLPLVLLPGQPPEVMTLLSIMSLVLNFCGDYPSSLYTTSCLVFSTASPKMSLRHSGKPDGGGKHI